MRQLLVTFCISAALAFVILVSGHFLGLPAEPLFIAYLVVLSVFYVVEFFFKKLAREIMQLRVEVKEIKQLLDEELERTSIITQVLQDEIH